MTHQNRRTVLSRQHALGRCNRLGQGRQRVLYGGDVKPCRLQSSDHFGPARTVGEQTVHQHDVPGFGGSGGCRQAAHGDQRGSCGGGKGSSTDHREFSCLERTIGLSALLLGSSCDLGSSFFGLLRNSSESNSSAVTNWKCHILSSGYWTIRVRQLFSWTMAKNWRPALLEQVATCLTHDNNTRPAIDICLSRCFRLANSPTGELLF